MWRPCDFPPLPSPVAVSQSPRYAKRQTLNGQLPTLIPRPDRGLSEGSGSRRLLETEYPLEHLAHAVADLAGPFVFPQRLLMVAAGRRRFRARLEPFRVRRRAPLAGEQAGLGIDLALDHALGRVPVPRPAAFMPALLVELGPCRRREPPA